MSIAYREVLKEVSAAIYRVDPLQIAGQADEYDPEAAHILAAARSASSVEDLSATVAETFGDQFWPNACSYEDAMDIAVAIWPAVRRLHRKN